MLGSGEGGANIVYVLMLSCVLFHFDIKCGLSGTPVMCQALC